MSITLMRKYSKPLMAFFGVILMIVFLAGYSYTSGLGKGGASYVVGQLNGRPITTGSLTIPTIDVRILRRLNPNLMPWLSQRSTSRAAIQFYLLLHEARQNGFLPDYNTAAAELSDKRLQTRLQKVLANSSYVAENVVQALGDYGAIESLAEFAYGAAQPSDPQLSHTLSEMQSPLEIGYIRLRASATADAMPAPSAGLLRKLFTKYRTLLQWDAESGTQPPLVNGRRYPFGFRYPDRVKMEFLKFDEAKVRAGMKVTFADIQAAYRYYEAHRADFAVTPSTQAAGSAAATTFKPFSQVKTELIRRQQDKQIQLLFRRMTEYARRITSKVWTHPEIDGYYTPEPANKWVSYRSLAAKIGRRFGYTPQIGRWNHWASAAALASLQGIGQASSVQSGFSQPVDLPLLAMKVRELDPKSKGLGVLLHLQVGRDGPVLTDADGNYYLYRITAVSPGHNPKTLSQVQSQVVRDARLLEAYKADEKRGKTLAGWARRMGLAAAAKKADLPVKFPRAFTALTQVPVGTGPTGESLYFLVPSYVPGVHGRLGRLTRAAIKLAREWQVAAESGKLKGAKKQATITQFLKQHKESQLIKELAGKPAESVAVDPRLEVFVVQLVQARPLPANILDLADLRAENAGVLNFQMRELYLSGWLRYKEVAARVGFVTSR